MSGINIDDLIYQTTGFAYSLAYTSSFADQVSSSSPYYFRWNSWGSADIVVVGDSFDVETLKFFRYPMGHLCDGINLDEDSPSFTGVDALRYTLRK